MNVEKNLRIHIKNNRWKKGSFPNTPEGEEVFTITEDRVKTALANFPHLNGRFETFIDWDEDNFVKSMFNSDILLTWNLPTLNINEAAPNLRWIHCIGAGIEHLLPIDWLPDSVALTNNKGVHAKKAGEYGLMAILMMHNHFPRMLTNQKKQIVQIDLQHSHCRTNSSYFGNRQSRWLSGGIIGAP